MLIFNLSCKHLVPDSVIIIGFRLHFDQIMLILDNLFFFHSLYVASMIENRSIYFVASLLVIWNLSGFFLFLEVLPLDSVQYYYTETCSSNHALFDNHQTIPIITRVYF